MSKIQVDATNPQFRKNFLDLEKDKKEALARVLKKISQMTWSQLYQDSGLKWEKIKQKEAYSFRFSQKYRAIALREGEYLRLISLHTDHDSAYH